MTAPRNALTESRSQPTALFLEPTADQQLLDLKAQNY